MWLEQMEQEKKSEDLYYNVSGCDDEERGFHSVGRGSHCRLMCMVVTGSDLCFNRTTHRTRELALKGHALKFQGNDR